MQIITKQLILQGKSDGGAWTRAQLSLIGVAWPPRGGWMDRVIGNEISEHAANEFVRLKNTSKVQMRKTGLEKTPKFASEEYLFGD